MKTIYILFLILIYKFGNISYSQTILNTNSKCFEILGDTFPQLNLLTVKTIKENTSSTLFIDTNQFDVSIDYVLSNYFFMKNGIEFYAPLMRDSSNNIYFEINKLLGLNLFMNHKQVLSNFDYFQLNSVNDDLYIKYSKYLVFNKYKLIQIRLETKNNQSYNSNILIIFDDNCNITKLISYDTMN